VVVDIDATTTKSVAGYAAAMELLRHVVILLHIVGFAVMFGARAMQYRAPCLP
jgi:hypothetical protein